MTRVAILFSGGALLAVNSLLDLTSINTQIDYVTVKMITVLSPHFIEKGCVPKLILFKIMVCVVQHNQMFQNLTLWWLSG